MSSRYDIAVVGGGIMGCETAVRLAEGGMKPVVLDQGDLGCGASGVNAGTLSLQIKRVRLIPYAIRGHAVWVDMGEAVGFHRTGGYTLAFTDREMELLVERMTLKRDAGVPIVFETPGEVALREPGLSRRVVAASYCAEDGYANPLLTGRYYRHQLQTAGVAYHERTPVTEIVRKEPGYRLRAGSKTIRASRLLLTCGGWLREMGKAIGVELPVRVRVNTVSVTERSHPLLTSVIGHASGLLTLKQKRNGTVLIGGGWQGQGTPGDGRGRVDSETIIPNLRLAQYALPGLSKLRLVRSWTGFEANAPDFYPLAGNAPGLTDAFILGCVRGGFTIGPYIARLMGDYILGREPELPLFDPDRFSENHECKQCPTIQTPGA